MTTDPNPNDDRLPEQVECVCGTVHPPPHDREAWENFEPTCRFCQNRKAVRLFMFVETRFKPE